MYERLDVWLTSLVELSGISPAHPLARSLSPQLHRERRRSSAGPAF